MCVPSAKRVRDPMIGSSNKATSPVVTAVILIVLIVAGTIIVYVFLVGVQQGFYTNSSGLSAAITGKLYSSDARIALLGDIGNFTVSVSNTLTTPQLFTINITSNGRPEWNNSYLLLPNQVTTVTAAQPLNTTGVWAVKVNARGINVATYYFQVMATRDEADFAVSQWQQQQFNRTLVYTCLFVASTAFVIAAASLARRPKTIIQAGT